MKYLVPTKLSENQHTLVLDLTKELLIHLSVINILSNTDKEHEMLEHMHFKTRDLISHFNKNNDNYHINIFNEWKSGFEIWNGLSIAILRIELITLK